MFSSEIVESEEFVTMPLSSQATYFHLGMHADDDGFVQPKIIMRALGANDDDLKILLAKRFLLPFDNGVVVIKHWLIHNMIRSDRYKVTRFQEEKNTLVIKQNRAYTDKKDFGCQNDNQSATQVRLGKGRLGEDIVSEASPEAPPSPESIKLSTANDDLSTKISPFRDRYTDEICKQFLLYWTQKNKTGTKELWQMQRVFDIEKRLAIWCSKEWHKKLPAGNNSNSGVVLHDGSLAVMKYGEWVDAANPTVKIDLSYYPELKEN